MKVTVIGAGLGGLAAAIALRQQGIDTQVYEKARGLQPIGAGLSLFPNGLNVLNAILPGLADSLIRVGSQAQRVNLRKSNGDLIAQNQLPLQEQYGQPMLNIRWSQLQETLASVLPPDLIHLNYRCVGFDQTDSGVEVQFENGETAQADVLIGADGIHSIVRQLLVGDGSPRYAGRLSWRAVLQYQHQLLPADEVTIMTSIDGKIFTLIDVGDGQIFWSAGALSERENLHKQATEVKSHVLETFAGWAEPVEAIVTATAAEAIVERPIWDRPPLESWNKGRVTLLGDAAHPMVPSLGQGANTAFEDAWELAQFLAQQPSIEAAFAHYENSRIPRTQVIQARSAFQGSRSYDTDSETFLRGIAEQARASQAEFEEWLYEYGRG
ncbi:FAD-dependent monooxygenase [Kovacikia minuta CCNUW1]|uniref:FAD-dependent monooxygenase n=1 Tax=Kovacikia minuta TaxID=2931930 RepID=UPI001CCD27DB|nr:FAD-dependent monooxygenase [Kovacikia minuta]UBF25852.1 FAD-dependent monooxygenase [Kovacikia minuta CCNUW1]